MRKENLNSVINWICAALACFALMVSMNADLSGINAEAAGGGLWTLLAANIKKLEYILPTFSYRDAFFALMILFFFYKVPCRWPEHVPRLSCRIPAVLAAFFLVFGYSFRYTNSWDLIFMDSFHLLISGVVFAGYYVLAVRLFQMVIRYLCKKAQESKASCGKWTTLLFETHAFAGPLLVIMIFWSPYILAKFPGASMPETLAEMRQFYWGTINNYYPPLHTIMLSLIMQLGNLLGSYTLGFFLNLVLQLAMLLSAFSYGFLLMKRWKTPYLFRYLALGIICMTQFFPMESTVVEKDIPYTACVVFLVLLLAELMRTIKDSEPLSKKQIAGLILVCLGTAGFRNEGIYLVLVSAVAAIAYGWSVIGKENLKKWKSILVAFLIPVVLILGYQKVLLPACGVEDNGPKEALSIPFQQTARYVRDYGAEVTAEEAEIIGKVLDYENLAELYDPITSDPVKYTYHAETTGELLDYFRVWAIQLVKHPANAVEATMNNAYGWFYQEGYTQNYMMTSRIDGQDVRWEINQPAKLAGVRQVMERVAKLLSRVPVLNWFENAGMVSMLLILLVAVWIGAGKKRYLVAVSPLIVAVLVCIAGPTFNYQMRYIMLVMFCVPFLAGLFVQSMREL